jgi:hypothetical protein
MNPICIFTQLFFDINFNITLPWLSEVGFAPGIFLLVRSPVEFQVIPQNSGNSIVGGPDL